MPPPESAAIPQPVPPGFTLAAAGPDAIVIRHRRTGMGCLNAFLLAWLAFWTVGCIFLARQYLAPAACDPVPLWVVLFFWVFEIFAALFAVYLFFCRKFFRIDRDRLVVETRLLGLRWTRTLPRGAIRRFRQVQDGGLDEDSFPSWGLAAEAERSLTLLVRQPYDRSQWLGQTLARWAGVEYIPAPPA